MLELFLQVLCWSIGLCFLLWGALWVLHRRVWHTGTPITKVLPPTPQRPCQVSFTQISGDVGANLVVKEMFDDYAYFKNGVQLPSRGSNNRPPLILDVGANIGLFALAVGTHPGMTEGFDIISFEIVPALRELVEKNTAGLNNGSTQRVRVVDCGLGSSRCDIDVTFEPTFTAGSSAHKDSITSVLSSEHGAIDFIAAWLHDVGVVGTIPMWLAKALCRLVRIPVLGVVAAAVIGVLGGVFLVVNKFAMPVHGQTVKGHIERLDDVLASLGEADATRPIAMLKIDVEGAEADVLDGIGDATWARVRQAVVEVHDIKGRVGRIKQMLESRGFIVEIGVEELAMHEIFHMSTIFAHRAP